MPGMMNPRRVQLKSFNPISQGGLNLFYKIFYAEIVYLSLCCTSIAISITSIAITIIPLAWLQCP